MALQWPDVHATTSAAVAHSPIRSQEVGNSYQTQQVAGSPHLHPDKQVAADVTADEPQDCDLVGNGEAAAASITEEEQADFAAHLPRLCDDTASQSELCDMHSSLADSSGAQRRTAAPVQDAKSGQASQLELMGSGAIIPDSEENITPEAVMPQQDDGVLGLQSPAAHTTELHRGEDCLQIKQHEHEDRLLTDQHLEGVSHCEDENQMRTDQHQAEASQREHESHLQIDQQQPRRIKHETPYQSQIDQGHARSSQHKDADQMLINQHQQSGSHQEDRVQMLTDQHQAGVNKHEQHLQIGQHPEKGSHQEDDIQMQTDQQQAGAKESEHQLQTDQHQ